MRNLKTWDNYARFADRRGRLVLSIIRQYISVRDKHILDIGSGHGGTARVLAEQGAMVLALDPYVAPRFTHPNVRHISEAVESFRYGTNLFDIIILQDVLEHLDSPGRVIMQAASALAPGGLLYLSTPNRWSPFNVISDPHWGVPVVAMLPRTAVRRIIHRILRLDTRQRQDWPALFSYQCFMRWIGQAGLTLHFCNVTVAQYIRRYPEAVLCAPWHLSLFNVLRQSKLDRLIPILVNDRHGMFNWWLNPTWYGIAVKEK